MSSAQAFKRFSWLIGAGLAAMVASAPAQANLAGPFTLQLLAPGGITPDGGATGDPTPLNFSSTLPGSDGTLAAPGDGSDIGSIMLPAESIVLAGQSFQFRLAAGSQSASNVFTTGYLGLGGEHARYVFSGLSVAGKAIVGLSLGSFDNFAGSGFSGLASPADLTQVVHLLSPTSFSLDLDTLVFKDRGNGGSNNYADVRIDLVTAAVPEPASAVLAMIGLVALAGLRRRR